MTEKNATSNGRFTGAWFCISLLLCLNSILSWYGRREIELANTRRQATKDFEKSVVDPEGAFELSVVVSHCKASLHWLQDFVSDVSVRNVTVVSKCGVTPDIDHLPNGTQLLQLPNVGRCDHTYAYWMSEIVKSNNEDGIILFLKDNMRIHQGAVQRRDKHEMISLALINGFGCSLKPRSGMSYFHDTATLSHYNMSSYGSYTRDSEGNLIVNSNEVFKSQFTNMGAWLEEMAISLPQPYTPVCYGGVFAVRKSRIWAVPVGVWQNLQRSLERGDNIEEGHFMERTWAGLLSKPIGSIEKEILANKTVGITRPNGPQGGIYGALKLESPDLPDLY